MLNEYAYVKMTTIENARIDKDMKLVWTCPNCDKEIVISAENIEDICDSDPHDPLYDYVTCEECETHRCINAGIEVRLLATGEEGVLVADGTFIYFINKSEEVVRIA